MPQSLKIEHVERPVGLGVGIYSQADAARLLRVTPTRLRRWVRGYTYQYVYALAARVGKQPPVVRLDLPVVRDTIALSFVELMELRAVKAMTDRGVSLQRIRTAARIASTIFGTDHPFASRQIFTEGNRIFSAASTGLEETPDVIELSKDKHTQLVIGKMVVPLLKEIDFDPSTSLAFKWWPLGKAKPIVLNPRVAFGAPTVNGTRIRTLTLFRMVGGSSVPVIARAFEVAEGAVEAAVHFERELAAA